MTQKSIFKCRKCPRSSFESKNSLDHHRRISHQVNVTLSTPNGKVTASRHPDNLFKCPNCPVTSDSSNWVHEHKNCYFSIPVIPRQPDPVSLSSPLNETISSSNSLEKLSFYPTFSTSGLKTSSKTFSSSLGGYYYHNSNMDISSDSDADLSANQQQICSTIVSEATTDSPCETIGYLLFHLKSEHLFCTICSNFIDCPRLVLNHLHEAPGIAESDLLAFVTSNPFKPFVMNLTEIREPFPFLIPSQGFRCKECFKCVKKSGSIRCHRPNFESQLIQTIKYGCLSRSFPVIAVSSSDPNEIQINSILEKYSCQLPNTIDPDFRRRLAFFEYIKWFKTESERTFIFDTNIHKLFEIPQDFVDSYLSSVLQEAWDDATDDLFLTVNVKMRHIKVEKERYLSYWKKIVYFFIQFEEIHLDHQDFLNFKFNAHIKTKAMAIVSRCDKETVFNFLFSLLEERPENSPFTSLILALRFNSVEKTGKIKEQSTIENEISYLIYLMKFTYIACARLSGNRKQFLDDYKHLIMENEPFCTAELFTLKAAARDNVIDNDPIVMTDPENMNLIQISDKVIDLRFPLIAFEKVKHKLHACQEKLLLGLDCNDFNDFIQRNTTGSNLNKDIPAVRKKFIQHIKSLPDLQNACLHEIKNDGTIVWKKSFKDNYIREFENSECYSRFLVHLGGGMPARGTELSTLILNDDGTVKRNIFVYGNGDYVFTKTTYSKPQHSTGVKLQFRFFDKISSRFLITQFVILRVFIDLLYQEKVVYNNEYLVYGCVRLGKVMYSDAIRSSFALILKELTGLDISFQIYRHSVKHIMRILNIKYDNDSFLTPEFISALKQFGHGVKTHRNFYAVEKDAVGPKDEFHAYRYTSEFWHSFLSGAFAKTQRSCVVPKGNDCLSLNAIEPEPKRSRCDPIMRTSYEANIKKINGVVDFNHIFEMPSCTADELEKSLNGPARKDALLCLRDLYGETAVFRHSQAKAAQIILHSKVNVVLALPTSGGKTMLIFLCCKFFVDKLTVVFVPTIALRQELEAKAKNFNICVTQEVDKKIGEARLLVLTYDRLAQQADLEWRLKELIYNDMLSKIFIDECHCLVTDFSFRGLVLKEMLNLNSYKIPLGFRV